MAVVTFGEDSLKFTLYSVNIMLQTINELPLNDDVDLANSLQGQLAQSVLEEAKKATLSEEWDFNRDTNYALAIDPAGMIPVPSNVLDIVSSDGNDIIVRNWRLYSKTNQSHIFEDSVKCNIVWDMEFNSLSHALRYYITIRASRIFSNRVIGDTTSSSFTRDDETEAYIAARRSDGRTSKYNMLNVGDGDSLPVGSFIGGIRWR